MTADKAQGEGNALIVTFMGGTLTDKRLWYLGGTHRDLFPNGNHYARPNQLSYHSSWDWLMPACKKWDELEIPDEFWREYERRCDLLDNVITAHWNCEDAFIQLSENIQWYKLNSK